jgi:hypothetical protein
MRERQKLRPTDGRVSTEDLPFEPPGLSISIALFAPIAVRDSDRFGLLLADLVVRIAR